MTECSFWLNYPFKTAIITNKTLVCKNILQHTGSGVLSRGCHDSAALTVMSYSNAVGIELLCGED